jgi:hypothetical protein
VVEPPHVLLRGLGVERGGVRVADLDERLGALLDQLEVLGVALLGFLAPGAVVGTLGGGARLDQVSVVLSEERQLALDQIREPQTSSR